MITHEVFIVGSLIHGVNHIVEALINELISFVELETKNKVVKLEVVIGFGERLSVYLVFFVPVRRLLKVWIRLSFRFLLLSLEVCFVLLSELEKQ